MQCNNFLTFDFFTENPAQMEDTLHVVQNITNAVDDLPGSINNSIDGEETLYMLLNEDLGPALKYSYIIVSLIGILGNTIFIMASRMKIIKVTPFVLLLLNISLADIVMNICFLPYLFIDLKDKKITSPALAGFLCSVVSHYYPVYAAFTANSITLCYISCARMSSFTASRSAKVLRLKPFNVRVFIVGSWVTGILSTIPSHFMFYHKQGIGCIPVNRKRYIIHLLVGSMLCCFVPILILTVNFFRTVYHLMKANEMIQSFAVNHTKQIIFLLLSLTVAFIVFSFPFLVGTFLHLTNQWDDLQFEKRKQVFVLIGMFTSISDPILYAICWRGFRDGFSRQFTDLKNRFSRVLSSKRSNDFRASKKSNESRRKNQSRGVESPDNFVTFKRETNSLIGRPGSQMSPKITNK